MSQGFFSGGGVREVIVSDLAGPYEFDLADGRNVWLRATLAGDADVSVVNPSPTGVFRLIVTQGGAGGWALTVNGVSQPIASAAGDTSVVDGCTQDGRAVVVQGAGSDADIRARLDSLESSSPVVVYPQRLVGDALIPVYYGTSDNAVLIAPTERNRRSLTIVNLLTVPISRASAGVEDNVVTAPTTGYASVNPGEEFVSTSHIAYWVYVPITGGAVAGDVAGHIRVCKEQSA